MTAFWNKYKTVIIAGVIVAVLLLVWQNRQALISKVKPNE